MYGHEGYNHMQTVELAHINDRTCGPLAGELAFVEYGYYLTIIYTVLGAPLGIILPGGVGTGFLLIPILALCVVVLGSSLPSTLRSAWLPLTCGTSYLVIQLAIHGERLLEGYVYAFGPWLISLIIVQALVMHRPDFLHRFALFTFFIGLAMLPFMSVTSGGAAYERMGLQRDVGYANPNAIASWFGFCVLYLTIRGYVETRPAYRVPAWLMAVGSLYVVTLTVSRGALFAVVASLLVGSRQLLKAGLLPVLLLAVLLVGIIAIGLFDQAIDSYTRRGGEETGRLKVWPLLLEKFLSSPLIGEGASRAGAVVRGNFITPHNSFLLFAVASGIVPLILFCAYCYQSGRAALHASASDQDSIFYLPFVIYTVMISSFGNFDFMNPWGIVSLTAPIAARVSRMNLSDVQARSKLFHRGGAGKE
jgi:O-antigen ligase